MQHFYISLFYIFITIYSNFLQTNGNKYQGIEPIFVISDSNVG